jgi:hypothetical protein
MRAADAPVAPLPILLEMIASDAVQTARAGSAPRPEGKLDRATLFERHVERWITGDPHDRVMPVQRARLVERLAAELWKLSASELPYAQLVAAVRANEPTLAELRVDDFDLVLRTAPFVTRSESRVYGFSHRSFLEYVLARYLKARARVGADALRAALTTELLDASCTSLFVELAGGDARVRGVVQEIVDGPYTAGATENAFRLAAALGGRAPTSPTGSTER